MTGLDKLAAERQRQIAKGYTVEHDRHHSVNDLRRAALAYLNDNPALLPWGYSSRAWKDQTLEERLVKAGALISAALDVMESS